MADTERKMQALDKIVKEGEKKGLTIKCKMTKCMRESEQAHDANYKQEPKQLQKLNYLGCCITDNRICNKNPKVHWNSKSCLPENKQNIKE